MPVVDPKGTAARGFRLAQLMTNSLWKEDLGAVIDSCVTATLFGRSHVQVVMEEDRLERGDSVLGIKEGLWGKCRNT